MDGGNINPEEIRAELSKIKGLVVEAGEKALAEAKKSGDMYAADKPKVDEMLVSEADILDGLARSLVEP